MAEKPTYDALLTRIEKLKKKALEQDSIIEKLAPIFAYSRDMIGSGNLQGYFTKVNPSFEHILGYREKDFLNAPFLDFVHPDDVEETGKALHAAAKGQPTIDIANRYRCKDGTYRWIDWRVQVFAEQNLFIAVGRDITEQKTLEQEVLLSERRHRSIIQTSNDGFVQMTVQGKITDCNSAYLRMSGYSRDELLTLHISDLEAKEDPDETVSHIQELIQSGRGYFESIHKRKDGGTFDVDVNVTFIPTENMFVSFIKDVTDRNRFLREIRESEQRFRQLAENIQEVFWLGSLDWQEIYYISPAYEKIWGKSCESLYNDPLSWLDPVFEQDQLQIRDAIPTTVDETTQTIILPDYRIHHPNGEIRWIRAQAFPIRNAQGKLYRIAGIAVDITEKKQEALERENLVNELQVALEQVKTLSGFLPICASCKKIRDEEGQWHNMEAYIKEHSTAEITHSICPLCALKLYPEYIDKDQLNKTNK